MAQFERLQHHLAIQVALYSLIFALLAGVTAFALEYRGQSFAAAQLQSELVATVQASAAIAAFVGNDEIAQEVANGLLMNPTIAAVEIQSLNGFSLHKARPLVEPGAVRVYALHSPVDPAARIGELRVFANTAEVSHRVFGAAWMQALWLVLQIAVSATLLMVIFARVVGRPLTRVAAALKEAKPGSSERLLVPAGYERNEIGALVFAGNELLQATEQAILEERRLQVEVDELNSHYQRIFDTTHVGVMILRPGGRLLNCNSTLMSRIVGLSFEAAGQNHCRDFIEVIFRNPAQAWAMVWQASDTGQTVSADLELASTDGRERWAHCLISVTKDERGDIDLIEGVLYDVTERRRRESEARQAAEVDPLTGLANRRGMEVALDQAIVRAGQGDGRFAVMMLDLDGFKAVNDTHGHAAGDEVLRAVGGRLLGCLRRTQDRVARLGGDEFTVILSDTATSPDVLDRVAGDMVRRIREPIRIENGETVQVGTSIGIAIYPDDGNNRSRLVDAADAAMYAVKRSGKNNYRLASALDSEARAADGGEHA